MEGPDDSLGLWPRRTEILTQWRQGGLPPLYPGIKMEWEWYRHSKVCNTLWVPGHVSAIKFTSLNKGVDYRLYTGTHPCSRPSPNTSTSQHMMSTSILGPLGRGLAAGFLLLTLAGCDRAKPPEPVSLADVPRLLQEGFKDAQGR